MVPFKAAAPPVKVVEAEAAALAAEALVVAPQQLVVDIGEKQVGMYVFEEVLAFVRRTILFPSVGPTV
jgi:hypothetical protein